MRISFNPVRLLPGDPVRISASVDGDVLTVEGDVLDFTGLADGTTMLRKDIPSRWAAGDVVREEGEVRLALIIPWGPKSPTEPLLPVTVTAGGGVDVPEYDYDAA